MDSSGPRTMPPMASLPQPADDPNLLRTFRGYRAALATMSLEQLMAHSADLAARIEFEQRRLLASAISSPLSTLTLSIDNPVIRSPRTVPRPSDSPDRGRPPSPSLRPSQSAVDLLAASKRLGPRIAAKLALHEARRPDR